MTAINRKAATKFKINDHVATPKGSGVISGIIYNRCNNRLYAIVSLDKRKSLSILHPERPPAFALAVDVEDLTKL